MIITGLEIKQPTALFTRDNIHVRTVPFFAPGQSACSDMAVSTHRQLYTNTRCTDKTCLSDHCYVFSCDHTARARSHLYSEDPIHITTTIRIQVWKRKRHSTQRSNSSCNSTAFFLSRTVRREIVLYGRLSFTVC